jgi:hypothetical protein
MDKGRLSPDLSQVITPHVDHSEQGARRASEVELHGIFLIHRVEHEIVLPLQVQVSGVSTRQAGSSPFRM